MKTTQRIILTLLIVLVVIGVDQLTKQIAQAALSSRPLQSYLGDTVRLLYSENTGAFLGLGADLPQWVRVWGLVVANSLVLVGVLVFVLQSDDMSAIGVAACALVIAGGIGNIIDRVLNDGRVVDFMNIGIGWLRTGIFNVADLAIVAGVALMLLWVLRERKKGAARDEAAE